MTLIALKRIARCALTGAPLTSDSLKLHVPEPPLKRRKPGYLETRADAGAIGAPLTLHRSQQEGAVGLEYSVMMAQYLNLSLLAQLSEQQRREHLDMVAWWRSDYGIYRRVLPGLVQRFGEDEAQHILLVVMECHREEGDPDVIGKRYGHSAEWVERNVHQCMRLANWHHKGCGCATCTSRKQRRGA